MKYYHEILYPTYIHARYRKWLKSINTKVTKDMPSLFNDFSNLTSLEINKDVYQYKSYKELNLTVRKHILNKQKSIRLLQNDYDIILDDSNYYIVRPNTKEAAKKLGLSSFRYRNNFIDSAWCITYNKNWEKYREILCNSFYFVIDKNIDRNNPDSLICVQVYKDGSTRMWDGDNKIIKKYILSDVRHLFKWVYIEMNPNYEPLLENMIHHDSRS